VKALISKKMDKEDLTKLYAKKNWLQKSSSFLNQIILKDMDDSEEGSDKDSEDKEEEDEDEDDDDDEEGGFFPGSKLIKGKKSKMASQINRRKKKNGN